LSYTRIETFDFRSDTPMPEGPPPFLVEGVLHRSQTILYGQTCAGKSMLAVSLAVAVASGQTSWLGQAIASGGRVAIVSGDPDGKYETLERLDKVRADLGVGQVRLIMPERPMAQESWFEIAGATEGCRLMFLDNLTQFVPGSLNDDNAVKLVYEQLQMLARRGMAICTLAHTSEKKNENGFASDVPLGSTIIRTVPRWFVYVRRTQGSLVAAFAGNGERPWELRLSEPTDTPRFEVLSSSTADELASRRAAKAQERDRAKLNKNAQMAAWWRDNCQGMSDVKAGQMLADEFGGTAGTHRVNIGRLYRNLPAET
jgi:hypothetical protein